MSNYIGVFRTKMEEVRRNTNIIKLFLKTFRQHLDSRYGPEINISYRRYLYEKTIHQLTRVPLIFLLRARNHNIIVVEVKIK